MGSSYTPPVNLSSPPPIGDVTPNTIAGTTIKIASSARLQPDIFGFDGIDVGNAAGDGISNLLADQLTAVSLLRLLGPSAVGTGILLCAANNTLAQRNGVNAQTLIVSKTFTDNDNRSEFYTTTTGSRLAFNIDEAGSGVGAMTGFTFNKNISIPTLNISAIPTSAAGLSSGDVWSNLGILTIVS